MGGSWQGWLGWGAAAGSRGAGCSLPLPAAAPRSPRLQSPAGCFKKSCLWSWELAGGGTGPVLSPASQKFPMTPVPGVLFVRSRVLGSVGTWGLPQCNVGLSPVCAGVPQRQ